MARHRAKYFVQLVPQTRIFRLRRHFTDCARIATNNKPVQLNAEDVIRNPNGANQPRGFFASAELALLGDGLNPPGFYHVNDLIDDMLHP